MRNKIIVLLALAAAAAQLQAQVSAAISGRVQDISGAGIPDVTVTVKSLETGASAPMRGISGGSS